MKTDLSKYCKALKCYHYCKENIMIIDKGIIKCNRSYPYSERKDQFYQNCCNLSGKMVCSSLPNEIKDFMKFLVKKEIEDELSKV